MLEVDVLGVADIGGDDNGDGNLLVVAAAVAVVQIVLRALYFKIGLRCSGCW